MSVSRLRRRPDYTAAEWRVAGGAVRMSSAMKRVNGRFSHLPMHLF